MNPTIQTVIDAAFVLLVVQFFKTQFGWTGWKVLLAAFLTCAVISLVPLIAASYPPIAPWLEAIVNIVVLFLGSAGAYDLVMAVRERKPLT